MLLSDARVHLTMDSELHQSSKHRSRDGLMASDCLKEVDRIVEDDEDDLFQELRRRRKGSSVKDEANSSVRVVSDYYTSQEILQVKKPKKKKCYRKKENFDIDALETEVIAAGLGAAGSFAADAEDYEKCLDKASKIARTSLTSGPEAIALIAASRINNNPTDDQTFGEPVKNTVVISEIKDFVQGVHIDEEVIKPGVEDFLMEEAEVTKSEKHVMPENEDKADIVADEIIREAPVGKGIAGVLKLLKERGALKETVEWGGRNMDKKKSKLVGIYDEQYAKEIRIERTDEFDRRLPPKEEFRLLSHSFHGKSPGKRKQEKRWKQYENELKLKRMKYSDTPSESAERIREAQARLKTPYLIVSGFVKPGT